MNDKGINMRGFTAVAALLAPLALGACDDNSTNPGTDVPTLLTVIPTGGDSDVDPNGPIVLRFSHSMMIGMEEYADLHEGHMEGPVVPGHWSWNQEMTELTFTPNTSLKGETTYVIHVGGGMQDEAGHHLNLGMHGLGMGGDWFTEDMHEDGHHGQGMGHGGGMGGGQGMMGDGWIHPENGGYGMVFTFTTGGLTLQS